MPNPGTGCIGRRLDGWANRDLNVGAIVALAPNLAPFADLLGTNQSTVRTVLRSWGPGKFGAELTLDGKAFNPSQQTDGMVTGTNVTGATLIPAAFGLGGVNLHTWTGSGSVPHWNAFVATLEMHGAGPRRSFSDAREGGRPLQHVHEPEPLERREERSGSVLAQSHVRRLGLTAVGGYSADLTSIQPARSRTIRHG